MVAAVIAVKRINLPHRNAEKISFAVFFCLYKRRKELFEGKNARLIGLTVEKIRKRAILSRNILH